MGAAPQTSPATFLYVPPELARVSDSALPARDLTGFPSLPLEE